MGQFPDLGAMLEANLAPHLIHMSPEQQAEMNSLKQKFLGLAKDTETTPEAIENRNKVIAELQEESRKLQQKYAT